jgi:hypothetical protein
MRAMPAPGSNMNTLRLSFALALLFIFSFLQTVDGQVQRRSVVSGEKVRNAWTWMRVAPKNEEFAVLMPDLPRVGFEKLSIDHRLTTITYYSLTQDEIECAVLSISGLENNKDDLAQMLLLSLYSKLIPTSDQENKQVAVKAIYQRAVSLNGYAGRESSLQAHNRVGMWRFYSVGKKFYAFTAMTTWKDDVLITRFLDSVTLGPTASTTTRQELSQRKTANHSLAAPQPTETWFIIVKTFSKTELPEASQRMSTLRGLGYEAHVVDTDYYPNLKKGFLAVAIGPQSKSAAKNTLEKVQPIAPGAYIKSGW